MGAPEDQANEGERKRRGFAVMDREMQRRIASKGGKMAHLRHTAHEFTSAEARAAGHLGGVRVSQDRQHMADIGRQGGRARRARAVPALGQQRTEGASEAPSAP